MHRCVSLRWRHSLGTRLVSTAAVSHGSLRHEAGVSAARKATAQRPVPEETKKRLARMARLAALSSHVDTPDPERKRMIDEMVRVDHAGEYGAVRIYQGQIWALRNSSERATLEHMKAQEEEHLRQLERLVTDRRVRPTLLLPLWDVAGLALGAGTALLGREAAMACTVAVEEVIGGHYNDQIRDLTERGYDEVELLAVLKKNRDEELEHLDTAESRGAKEAPFYSLLTEGVKAGCRAAVWVAKRI